MVALTSSIFPTPLSSIIDLSKQTLSLNLCVLSVIFRLQLPLFKSVSSQPLNMEGIKGNKVEKPATDEEEHTCQRCKQTYTSSSNNPDSCRYHPSFFVCRRHDDQKRYYELRDDDPPYAAKFYDCCGAEDPQAPGCATGFHVSYDG